MKCRNANNKSCGECAREGGNAGRGEIAARQRRFLGGRASDKLALVGAALTRSGIELWIGIQELPFVVLVDVGGLGAFARGEDAAHLERQAGRQRGASAIDADVGARVIHRVAHMRTIARIGAAGAVVDLVGHDREHLKRAAVALDVGNVDNKREIVRCETKDAADGVVVRNVRRQNVVVKALVVAH